jgi:small-conductance mechanosensitive channel
MRSRRGITVSEPNPFSRLIGRLLPCVLVAVALCFGNGAARAAETESDWRPLAEQRLPVLEKTVRSWQQGTLPSDTEIGAVYQEAIDLRKRAQACEAEYGPSLEANKKKLDALGVATEDEQRDIRQARAELDKERKQIERDLGVCRLLKLGAEGLLEQIQQLRQQILSRALSQREDPTW